MASSTTPTSGARAGIVTAKDFDIKQLYIDPVPQRNKSGGKYIRVCYGPKKSNLRLQSPNVYMPFGVSSFEDDKGVTTQSIEVSLRGHDDPAKPVMQLFHNVLHAIDEAILDAAEANSKAWFGKELPKALLRDLQKTLIKPPRDPRYAPLLKTKAVRDYKTNEMPRIFDIHDMQTVHGLDYIIKGTTGKITFILPSIYLIQKTFGVSARLLQVVVTNRPALDEGCLLVPDDDDDDVPPTAPVADDDDDDSGF
jgi:hypothetical protein